MYLCDCWIVVAYDRWCICVIVESFWPVIGHVFVWLLNRCGLWSGMHLITGHNDSTSTQIHHRSQAIAIQQAHKCMPDHRPQRFNIRSVMYLYNCWIVVAWDRSCICLVVESLWPVIGHVYVWLLNRFGLWSGMYLFDCWIVLACDRSCICVIVESLWPVIGHVFAKRFNNHTYTWPITGHNDSTTRQIHDRSQATMIQQLYKYMTDHWPQRFH
jgi:hypothetical protein